MVGDHMRIRGTAMVQFLPFFTITLSYSLQLIDIFIIFRHFYQNGIFKSLEFFQVNHIFKN